MNERNSKDKAKIILFTSNLSSVAIPIVEFLINNGFYISGILCERRINKIDIKKYSLQWIKNEFKGWEDLRLVVPFVVFKFTKKYRNIARKNKARKARADGITPFNEFNTVEDLSARYGIPLKYVNKINDLESREFVSSLKPDIGLSIASRILKPQIFQVPRLGTINLHSMTLPFFRGLSPVGFREIIAGFEHAKIHIHFIEEELDTGNLLIEETIKLRNFSYDLDLIEQESFTLAKTLFVQAINLVLNGDKGKVQQKDIGSTVTMPTKTERLAFLKMKNKLRKLKN